MNDEDNNNHFDEGKEISTIYKYKILFLIYYYTRSYQLSVAMTSAQAYCTIGTVLRY